MYTKDKGFTVTFRIDNTAYMALWQKFQDNKRIFPKLTWSEFLRNCLRIYALK